MASSSSANYSYDVFLSFRGTDTRNNFTSHLHKALCDNNVKAFIDNRIDRGEEITSFLEKIIEGAKLSIIVFSPDYASSTFCLDEMVKIMECKETKAQIVLPIFYKVYPSEEMYKEAFARHEQAGKQETIVERLKLIFWRALHWITIFLTFRRYEERISQEMKVERWRSSFQKALELAGWHIDNNRNEAAVIEEITRVVVERLNSQFEGAMQSTTIVGETSEDYLEKIMQCLMKEENPKVGVWGMGGVGKTTIVTHIYNTLLNDATYSRCIYWVTVSKDSSISKLQGDIAKVIKLDLSKEDNESKRAAKLFTELKRINKFVLILDDVWEPFETEGVGIPLMGGRKLLLTTRHLRVCQRMMCQPIEVKPLFEHEALDLFMKESNIQISDFGEWSEIILSIVKECAGLPLAVVVARTMRGIVEIRTWRNTLRELQKPCQGENPEIEEKVFKVLKFSYDHLRNDRCRRCFLYCSLFPEDHQFNRDDLIEYWIGEGLIDEVDCRQAELDKGNAILNELLHSSLLENSGTLYKLIKMHDVIRDMARITVKVGLQFQDPLESVQVVDGRMLKSFPNSKLHCSKLKTLVLEGYDIQELSGCLFVDMQKLNVLHMTNIGNVKSIPDCINKLGNLKLLIISHCDNLERIPSLVGLEKLQHLKISWNESLKEIPNGIDTMVNLRVLNLSLNQSLSGSFPSGVLEKLSHLQTLDLRISRVEVEAEALISLGKLEMLSVHFYSLHKFNCYVKSGHWRRLVSYQIDYGICDIESLKLGDLFNYIVSLKEIRDVEEWKGESSLFLPANMQYLELLGWESPMFNVLKNPTFVHLHTITIEMYKSKCLFTLDLAKQLLHNVRRLDIFGSDGLEEIIGREEECVNKSYCINYPTILLPKLKILKLSRLPELKSIYKGKMVCSSLEFILIEECDKVERLPFCMEKKGNKQNIAIKLRGSLFDEHPEWSKWLDSLQWDDPNAKSMYQPVLTETESEAESE